MFALASTQHCHGHDCKPVRSIMIALGDSWMQQRNDALVMRSKHGDRSLPWLGEHKSGQ